MSVEFDTHRCVCVCRLNLADGRMSVYRSINQFVNQICVSVEFDSEGVKFGRQGIGWLVVLRLNVPVNNFSVMSGRSHRFLGN